MKRTTAEELKKLMPVFQWNTYKQSEDKIQYIHDLILVALHKRKITQNLLCMNELIQIINNIEIPLRTNQMSQLYLYSTYQRYENLADTKKKIMAILNNEKKKIDPKAAAEWIHDKIERQEIIVRPKERIKSTVQPKRIQKKVQKLPSLIGNSTEKLQDQLKYLIEIFEEMEKQRQNSGLIPMNDDNEDNQVQVPYTHIPYDPQLYDLNNKLCKLRIKAQDRLARIIELARQDVRIRKKLEEAIERFQKARIEANEKVGRMAAMKAQKRLQEKKQKEYRKLREVQLGENEDLVHASHLYSLLTLPQIKHNRLII